MGECQTSIGTRPLSKIGLMTASPLQRIAIAAVLLITVTAPCAQSQGSSRLKSVSPADPDTTTLPYAQFEKFLSLAIPTRAPRLGIFDSVYTCREEENYADMRWVADSRILSVSVTGDSGRAAAVLTVVARQKDDGPGWKATFGIREDTAHWALKRDTEADGRWKVCGDSFEQFGVFRIGRDVQWLRGDRTKALAAVDSIRRVRGLPVVR